MKVPSPFSYTGVVIQSKVSRSAGSNLVLIQIKNYQYLCQHANCPGSPHLLPLLPTDIHLFHK